jgi:hypothetical protein
LYTGISGDHAHHYKDIFHSGSPAGLPDTVAVPANFGSQESNLGKLGYQMDRNTFNAGNHNHLLNGPTLTSNANLAYTGNSQPFDNRQAYTVVQYIIYIQN